MRRVLSWKVISFIILVMLLSMNLQAIGVHAAGYSPKYQATVKITNHLDVPLYNYTVRIVLNSSIINYNMFRPDGGDIRFKDRHGKLLGYWIERWNVSGDSIIWVKIPEIPASGTSEILMLYGDMKASNIGGVSQVMETLPSSDGPGYIIYYQESILEKKGIIGGGVATGWRADDYQYAISLISDSLVFPYYDKYATHIAVATNGYIEVNGTSRWSDYTDSFREFIVRRYIAPMWDDLVTWGGYNIYLNKTYEDEFGKGLLIRWRGAFYYNDGYVNVEAILYKNGLIRFNYGDIYSRWRNPLIGVSRGDGQHYTLSVYSGMWGWMLNNVNSTLFWPRKLALIEPTIRVIPRPPTLISVVSASSIGIVHLKVYRDVGEVKLYTYIPDPSQQSTWRFTVYQVKVLKIQAVGHITYIDILINLKVGDKDNWLPGKIIIDYNSGMVFLFGPIIMTATF